MSLMVGPALSQFHESRVHINDKGLVTRSVWQIVTVEKEKEKEKVEERKLELAAPSPEPELPPVYIEVICEYKTEFGQLLRLFWWCDEEKNAAGNLLSSGTKGVVPMVWSEGNIWRVTLQQPKRSFIHFKLEVAVEKVNAVVRREFLGYPGHRTIDFLCSQTQQVWWDSTQCQVVPAILTTTNHHKKM